jgi:hypothetical protein
MPFPLSYLERDGVPTPILMDGSEQTLVQSTHRRSQVGALVDLTNMQAGDSVTIRTYLKQEAAGAYVQWGEESLSDAQAPINMLRVIPLPVTYGIKITLQQTAGGMRTITYTKLEERRP